MTETAPEPAPATDDASPDAGRADTSIDPTELDLDAEDDSPTQDPDAYEGDSTLAGLGGTDPQEGGAG